MIRGLGLVLSLCFLPTWSAQEPPAGQQAKPEMERLVLDDMEDVSDWYNGSPIETKISADTAHVKEGRRALKFANRVDHTQGEKNYPIGWPRTGKDLARKGPLTDWTGYDFFECWIYADTNREKLPDTPLNVGFYHSGPKRSTSFRLKEVRKGTWRHIVIPIEKLAAPADVRRVQFNISESNYKHGDRVDFWIDDMVLTRYRHPVIGQLEPVRRLLYTNERVIRVTYALQGFRGDRPMPAVLQVGRDAQSAVQTVRASLQQRGELALRLQKPLPAGTYRVELTLTDADGHVLDRKETSFRVIDGPF